MNVLSRINVGKTGIEKVVQSLMWQAVGGEIPFISR